MNIRSTVAAVWMLGVGIGAASAADSVSGDALRSTVSGKTVHISTPLGTVPVSFRVDGTMSGRSQGLASYAFAASDRGRWWVSGDRLCQKWEQWFDKATHCFAMKRAGKTLYWSGAGRSGVATIAN